MDLYKVDDMSHPLRVRGLKHCTATKEGIDLTSHPLRVRGLKHDQDVKLWIE